MVRSYWKRTLATSFAWAGLALAQQPSPTSPQTAAPKSGEQPGRLLTVQEQGRPDQKCKLVEAFRTPEGHKAYQVQVVATGEYLTIVEMSAAGQTPGSKAVTTRIYHWGKSATPPPGTPLSPSAQLVRVSAPAPTTPSIPSTMVPRPMPSGPAPVVQGPSLTPTVAPVSASEHTMTIQEPGKPAQQCRVVKSWRTSDGHTAHEVQALDTGETVTIVEGSERGGLAARTGDRMQTLSSRVFHWSRSGRPTDAPVPPGEAIVRVPGEGVTTPVTTVEKVTATSSTPAQTEVVASASKPTDWRSSWGKVEDIRPSKPVEEPKMPQTLVGLDKQDPLTVPGDYSRRTADQKPAVSKIEMIKVPSTGEGTKQVAMVTKTSEPAPKKMEEMLPPGSKSVLDAGSMPGQVTYLPVPMVTIPDARRAPEAPVLPLPVLPQAPQLKAPAMTNAFTPAPSGVVAGSGNAFSVPVTQASPMTTVAASRPVPQSTSSPVTQVVYQPGTDRRLVVAQAPVSASTGQESKQLMATLRDSLYPSQRELAAEKLCTVNWQSNPEVVGALVTAAREDPAATVRAGCVRCLVKMKVNTPTVVATIQALKSDPDLRVRQEVDRATSIMTSGQPAPIGQALQPVGFVVPGK